MGIFDKARQKLGENQDKIGQVVDRAGDLVDERTGGKYADKIDRAQNFAKDQADRHLGDPDRPSDEQPPTEDPPHG